MKFATSCVTMLWVILVTVGCSPPPAHTVNARPPAGATHLVFVGNGWYTFEWRDQCFLFKSGGKGSLGLGHITKIDCDGLKLQVPPLDARAPFDRDFNLYQLINSEDAWNNEIKIQSQNDKGVSGDTQD